LVKTEGDFDFKNRELRAENLVGYCPLPCQTNGHPTITLCNSCFDYGLPGNLFYGHIGRFCGFTLNALQLGSQFANLLPDGGASWDTSDDTAAITLGSGLPVNISISGLCNVVSSGKESLESQVGCTPCEKTLRGGK
jgi:Bacterial toxin 44